MNFRVILLRNTIDFASMSIISLLAKRRKKSIDFKQYNKDKTSFLKVPYLRSALVNIHQSGTRLDFGTEQIAIFIGELYFYAAIHFAS